MVYYVTENIEKRPSKVPKDQRNLFKWHCNPKVYDIRWDIEQVYIWEAWTCRLAYDEFSADQQMN